MATIIDTGNNFGSADALLKTGWLSELRKRSTELATLLSQFLQVVR
jgi:hypothetical protein